MGGLVVGAYVGHYYCRAVVRGLVLDVQEEHYWILGEAQDRDEGCHQMSWTGAVIIVAVFLTWRGPEVRVW